MNAKIYQRLANRKSRMQRRLDKKRIGNTERPVYTAANIHYDFADRLDLSQVPALIDFDQNVYRRRPPVATTRRHRFALRQHLTVADSL